MKTGRSGNLSRGDPFPSVAGTAGVRARYGSSKSSRLKVLFICTGLGIINRGFETFFREAFDALRCEPGLELRLLKGRGPNLPGEQAIAGLSRYSPLAKLLGRFVRRDGYVIEQWTALISVIREIRRSRPQIIYYSDANLGFLLHRLRDWTGVPFKLLFSNGGPIHPPFVRTDYVHQVAPSYYHEALRAGERAERHFLLPYGIKLVPPPAPINAEERNCLRQRLGLPLDRKIVLSVGWIRCAHKRMDYVIKEVSALPTPRPFLQLLGAIDDGSQEVVDLGMALLGKNGFAATCVPHQQVFDFYRAADCFVLASLQEGFGRVYLESLMHGLPTIAHGSALTRYVLGSHALEANLRKPGELTRLLRAILQSGPDRALQLARWQTVHDRFSWQALIPGYRAMFESCRPAISQANA